jgi:hypothetical protein
LAVLENYFEYPPAIFVILRTRMNLPHYSMLLRSGAAVFAVTLASCTLLGPSYDATTSDRLNDLALRTRSVLDEARAGRLSPARSEAFLHEGVGIIGSLEARAGSSRLDRDLAELKGGFQQVLNRGTPIRPADGPILLGPLAKLQTEYGILTVSTSSDSSSSSSITDDCTTTAKEEEKKKKHKDDDCRDNDKRRRDKDDCDDKDRRR